MSNSVRPHRWQPTRLPCPWGCPGKNSGVGCHFLLHCMKGKSEIEVAQLCPTPSDPMDCGPPGSSTHWIFQARVLEWGAIAFSKVIKVKVKSLSRARLFATPWIVACTKLLHPWDFQGKRYWSGLPFPSPGNLPVPGIEPRSLTL